MNALQIGSLGVGIVLALYASLSYESEEVRLIDWIESTWIRVTDLRFGSFQWSRAIIRAVAGRCNDLLSSIYGSQLFSLNAIIVSLSTGAFLLGITFLSLARLRSESFSVVAPMHVTWYIAFLLTLVWWFRNPRRSALLHCILTFGFCLFSYSSTKFTAFHPDEFIKRPIVSILEYLFPIGIMSTVDAAGIAANRLLIQLIANGKLGNSRLEVLLLAILILSVIYAIMYSLIGRSGSASYLEIAVFLSLLTLFSTTVFVVPTIFLTTLLLLVISGALKFVVPRAMYSVIKLELLKTKKLFAIAGALIFAGSPTTLGFIERLVKAVGG